jgi:uncharacterized membrane protein YkvA (DUF1232 family)
VSTDELAKYGRHYSERGFKRKIARMPRRACRGVVEQALTLYAVLTDRETPVWARALIVGALGYFIWPLDAIPDGVPVLGYADDVAVMAFALSQVAQFVTPAVRRRVERLMPEGLKRRRN